jgi:molybdopterin molybdotransferase
MTTLAQALAALADYRPDALRVEQAEQVIRALVQPAEGVEQVALRDALDRVLAGDLVSPFDIPGYDSSAMDGWAVRSKDLRSETQLEHVGNAYAGRPFAGELGAGQCVRIMTGALLPRGADTVVMQEAARAAGSAVTIPAGQKAGQNVRLAGEDVAKGSPALRAGTLLRPAQLGMAASLGFAELAVRRRLRVAFFSSGDELTLLGQPLAPGQVYDSNRHALWAMLTRLGCEAVDLGVVRDDPAALEAALKMGASGTDAIVTTGGASEGDADFTRQVAAQLGEVVFWKLALRPGRPLAFGRIESALFFGLPGNPVAAMVAFYRLVRPALLTMMGSREPSPPVIRVQALEPMRKRAGRDEYQRGILERNARGELGVRLTGGQGSAMISSMCDANCLVMLPSAVSEVKPGDAVDVVLMDSLT